MLESVFQHAPRRSLASLKFSDQMGVTYFLEAQYFVFFNRTSITVYFLNVKMLFPDHYLHVQYKNFIKKNPVTQR